MDSKKELEIRTTSEVYRNSKFYFSVKQFVETVGKSKDIQKAMDAMVVKAYWYAKLDVMFKFFGFENPYVFIDTKAFSEWVKMKMYDKKEIKKVYDIFSSTRMNDDSSLLFESLLKMFNEWLKEYDVYLLRETPENLLRYADYSITNQGIYKLDYIHDYTEAYHMTQLLGYVFIFKKH